MNTCSINDRRMNRYGRRKSDHRQFWRISTMQLIVLVSILAVVTLGKKINLIKHETGLCRHQEQHETRL